MTSASNPTPETRWETLEDGAEYGYLKVPGTGTISTTLYGTGETGKRMSIGMFVSERPDLQRTGNGKDLLRLAMAEARQKGAVSAFGRFISQSALGAFAGVVGEENITFTEQVSGEPVDITLDEAMDRPADFIAHAPVPEPDIDATVV